LLIVVCVWLNLCVSGKFPETAWRAVHKGSWKRNRLAAHSRPPSDA